MSYQTSGGYQAPGSLPPPPSAPAATPSSARGRDNAKGLSHATACATAAAAGLLFRPAFFTPAYSVAAAAAAGGSPYVPPPRRSDVSASAITIPLTCSLPLVSILLQCCYTIRILCFGGASSEFFSMNRLCLLQEVYCFFSVSLCPIL